MLLLEMGSSDRCPPFRGSRTIHWAGTQRLLSPAEAHIQDAAAPAGWTSPSYQDKKETQPESHAAPSSCPAHMVCALALVGLLVGCVTSGTRSQEPF